jgi:hypothetical protein
LSARLALTGALSAVAGAFAVPALPVAAVLVGACGALASPALAENMDPNADGSQWAYGENVGWINAQPLGPGGPGVQVGDFSLSGWMWGENIGWISLSCANTATCGAASYGVVNDGSGNLSGYAWSENAGWINFAPAGGGVSVDVATGEFTGMAWAENAGWITVGSPGPGMGPSLMKTSWCSGLSGPPGAVTLTSVSHTAGGLELAWDSAKNAAWYDVVSGNAGTLQTTGGDFSLATLGCAASKHPATSILLNDGGPPPGAAYFYIVRASNCRGHGTYDGPQPPQLEPRDLQILASGNDCP